MSDFFPHKDTELARRAAVLLALTRELTSGIQKRKADKEHQFFRFQHFAQKIALNLCSWRGLQGHKGSGKE